MHVHQTPVRRSAGRRLAVAASAVVLAASAGPPAASAATVLAGFGNASGLGIDAATAPPSPIAIPDGPADATAAAVGAGHSLVLTPAAVLSTGRGPALGLGSADTSAVATTLRAIPDTAGVLAVAAGDRQSLLLRGDGTVDGFGLNGSGQAGGAIGVAKPSPSQIPGLAGITAIGAGATYGLALDGDGAVWAWGERAYLGNDSAVANTGTPVRVRLPGPARAISAGYTHALALLRDGEVWAWGTNGDGELGQGDADPTATTAPVRVTGLGGLDVKAVSAGYATSFALLQDGSFRAWGYGELGALGLASGSDADVLVPTAPAPAVAGLYPAGGFDALAAAEYTTYAISRTGRNVYAWGYQYDVQRRLGGRAARAFPYGSANPITETSDTEVPQKVGRLQNVPWLAVGGLGGQQLLLTDTVLRARNESDSSFYAQEVGTAGPVHFPSFQSYGGSSVVTGVRIVGADAPDFQLVRSDGTGVVDSFPYTIPDGGGRSVAVRFAPTAEGVRTAALEVSAVGETIRIPLEGFGTPATRGPKGDKGEKGDTVVVTVPGPPGPAGRDGRDGTFSLAAFQASATVARGRTARLSFVLLNGTATTLARTSAAVTVPKGLGTGTVRAVALPALRSGASRRFAVPVRVGRQARAGRYAVTVRVAVGKGRALTQRVTLRVAR
jgi:Regulator of chromosome condensation (RCC1) repeat/NPCBM-associated, NEW3 domain of alpha-galactosidase